MYAVNIALGTTVWRLLFNEEEKARKIFAALSFEVGPPEIKVEDDFGQILTMRINSLVAVMFEDLNKAKMANVELFLHAKRVESMQLKAAQADPGLKASSLMNGPSVLTPNFPRQ